MTLLPETESPLSEKQSIRWQIPLLEKFNARAVQVVSSVST